MTTLPTRAQIDRAEPLDFNTTRTERQANITIEGELSGLLISVEFTAAISTIPAAVEKLKAIGMASAARAIAPAGKPAKAQRVEPKYNDAGEPCCPKHNRPLKEGKFGLYCSAKDDSTERGYCSLKFAE